MNIDRQHQEQHEQYGQEQAQSGQPRSALVAILAAIALFVLLRFPAHPKNFTLEQFSVLPLEWPILIMILAVATYLLGRIAFKLFCVVVVAALGLLLLMRIADVGSYFAFGRRFSPLLELHLIDDGWHLASTSIGRTPAVVAVVVSLVALALLCFGLYRGLGALGDRAARIPVLGVLALVAGAAGAGMLTLDEAPVSAGVVPEIADRGKAIRRSIDDQKEFIQELAEDTVDPDNPPTFAALKGRDMMMVFVESYGRSFIVDEFLGIRAAKVLSEVQEKIDGAGVYARSGYVDSPVRGGRSWLAHATLASGLNITNQARFDRLITTDRKSVYRLFEDAGWSTFGVIPAIIFDWPAGTWYGFQDARVRDRMGYEGKDFGYVTMPDQYTLSAFENNMRHSTDGDVAAEIALLSSHAPWSPTAEILPWDSIGDGSIFDGSNRYGGPTNWKDRQHVRDQYATSLEYTLKVVGEYAERHAKGSLMIIMGDHQPAPIIAGWANTSNTPIHIISDDPELLARLPDEHFTDGMQPDESLEHMMMSGVRGMVSSIFEE